MSAPVNYAYPRGRTERETCDLNGWTVGTILHGYEQWGEESGIWTTIQITALGEEIILARCIREEITGRDESIISSGSRRDHEGTWTLSLRDWRPSYPNCAVAR